MTASLRPICGSCHAVRDDLGPTWIETARAGRRLVQVDTGRDFMFAGITIGEAPAFACPSCGQRAGVMLVRSEQAASISSYFRRHLHAED
jgi:hypothetical protein